MRVISKEELKHQRSTYTQKVLRGEVFIHPTDTIYGIGCNALDQEAVSKIRMLKDRDKEKPFSVIAPSKGWIRTHCQITPEVEGWLDKLPGPYTLILDLKNTEAVAENIVQGKKTIGVRIPAHWISEAIAEIGVPVVTTSVNRRGEDVMVHHEDLDGRIRQYIDFFVDEGPIEGTPSTIVNLTESDIEDHGFRKVI